MLVEAVECSPSAMFVTGRDGVIQYVNRSFTQLTGYTPAEALGQTPRLLKGGFLTPDFYTDFWRALATGEPWHGVFHNRRKSGEPYWELTSISSIKDAAGAITHFVAVKEDITELKHSHEELSRRALHDPLTGLPNRDLFQEHLAKALDRARRAQGGLAVFFLDLDGFKAVNDNLGHVAGDVVLCMLASRIQACVRASDLVARMGGDEFTILMEGVPEPGPALKVVRLILRELGRPCELGAATVTLGASVGIALYPSGGQTAEALVAAADGAMYQVKREGKHGFRLAE
jgi:diguanylate cyclase (GGDEF)-like protein/PAS domain S-box-containing protein